MQNAQNGVHGGVTARTVSSLHCSQKHAVCVTVHAQLWLSVCVCVRARAPVCVSPVGTAETDTVPPSHLFSRAAILHMQELMLTNPECLLFIKSEEFNQNCERRKKKLT